MKSKYRFRRILSGVMAAVTILSTVISPLTVYASEEPKAAEPPAYESVKDQLDENEVVKATDLELEVGQDFDVSTDFTNLEIKDESKVKVTFQKAENDAGENFSTSHADTYHAVYYVEPVNQNHPVYQIGRNLIVKEPVTAAQSEPQTEQAVTEEDTGSDDEEAASQEETETVPVETEIVEPETAESETEEPEETEPEFQGGLSESEFDAALEEAETENTTDKESGLTLSDVLEQAGEQDIDLMAMEDALDGGLRYHNYEIPDYESIKKVFGEKSARLFVKNKGYHAYWGYTSSDDSPITQFFTTDSFEIEDKDFYLNGRACVW